MLSKRIIACLDVRNGQVVKGINFEGLRNAGDPAELAERYNHEGIDEVVILDVTATIEGRQALAATVSAVAKRIFIPLTVGGGIRSEDDAAAAIDAGAEKVSLNTAALNDPSLITTLASRYGSQAAIVAIDAKWVGGKAVVYARSGQAGTEREAVEWAKEAADVRDLVGPVGPEALALAAHERQPRASRRLAAALEQPLKAEADAEQRPAALDDADDCVAPGVVHGGGLLEIADARHDDALDALEV